MGLRRSEDMSTDAAVLSYFALLGAPNCGKTVLFNGLTGSNAKVAETPANPPLKSRVRCEPPSRES